MKVKNKFHFMNIEMNYGNPLWTRVVGKPPSSLNIPESIHHVSLSNCWGFDKECDPGEGKDSRFQALHSRWWFQPIWKILVKLDIFPK